MKRVFACNLKIAESHKQPQNGWDTSYQKLESNLSMRKFSNIRPTTSKELERTALAYESTESNERFVPNLARTCAPLRPLLCRTNEWNWTDEHEMIFQTIKKEIQKNHQNKTIQKERTFKNCL